MWIVPVVPLRVRGWPSWRVVMAAGTPRTADAVFAGDDCGGGEAAADHGDHPVDDAEQGRPGRVGEAADQDVAGTLERVRADDTGWVDRTNVDSCHKVGFELHEDLIATLGLTRGDH
jgi:hypothetical protein